MPPRPFRRLRIEIGRFEPSEIEGMCGIFWEAFRFENPKLARIVCASPHFSAAVEETLRSHARSRYNKFMIAFDTTEGLVADPGFEQYEDGSHPDEHMSYGWISVGVVPNGATLNSYAASELSVYASMRMLATKARDRGVDPQRLTMNDPRGRLAYELERRSKDGQTRYTRDTHLVINTLAMWPDSHHDSTWEMARKLLGWAVGWAETHDWPIWTQIPASQVQFFQQAGFREVRSFTLDLNDFASSSGTGLGGQEWVQMAYSASRQRRVRSVSPPRDRSVRRRRPSF